MHFWEVQMEAWVKTAESRHGSLIKANRHMRLTLEKADKVSCALCPPFCAPYNL